MSRAVATRGVALPLVLLVLLLLGAAAFAASFAATLDSAAARSALDSAAARAQASGALAFAVAELVALGPTGLASLPAELGPWPDLESGVTVVASLAGVWTLGEEDPGETAPGEESPGQETPGQETPGGGPAQERQVIELVARAETGRGSAEASAKIVLQPGLAVIGRYLR